MAILSARVIIYNSEIANVGAVAAIRRKANGRKMELPGGGAEIQSDCRHSGRGGVMIDQNVSWWEFRDALRRDEYSSWSMEAIKAAV